jgi:hypothetical protein
MLLLLLLQISLFSRSVDQLLPSSLSALCQAKYSLTYRLQWPIGRSHNSYW